MQHATYVMSQTIYINSSICCCFVPADFHSFQSRQKNTPNKPRISITKMDPGPDILRSPKVWTTSWYQQKLGEFTNVYLVFSGQKVDGDGTDNQFFQVGFF